MKSLVVPSGFPAETATELAIANGCGGFYTGIPPVWAVLAEEQAWTIPCIVTEDENGNVTSWTPVV